MLTSGWAPQRLGSLPFSLLMSYLCSGMWMRINPNCGFLIVSRIVMGEEEEGSAEEVRRIKWHRKSLSPLVWFSCVSTNTHLWRTVPFGRELNLGGDEPSLTASFFGVFLFPSFSSVLGLCTLSVLATCACNPRIPLPFLIDWSFSAVIRPYRNLKATQRFFKVEDSAPCMLS